MQPSFLIGAPSTDTLAEISQLTRFDVSARFIKAGRRIEKVVIEWTEKPDLTKVKAEQDRPKVGRKARRDGTAETVALAFPTSGSVKDVQPWDKIARDSAPSLTGDMCLSCGCCPTRSASGAQRSRSH